MYSMAHDAMQYCTIPYEAIQCLTIPISVKKYLMVPYCTTEYQAVPNSATIIMYSVRHTTFTIFADRPLLLLNEKFSHSHGVVI